MYIFFSFTIDNLFGFFKIACVNIEFFYLFGFVELSFLYNKFFHKINWVLRKTRETTLKNWIINAFLKKDVLDVWTKTKKLPCTCIIIQIQLGLFTAQYKTFFQFSEYDKQFIWQTIHALYDRAKSCTALVNISRIFNIHIKQTKTPHRNRLQK